MQKLLLLFLIGISFLYAQESQNLEENASPQDQAQVQDAQNKQDEENKAEEGKKTWELNEIVVTPSANPREEYKQPNLIYTYDQKNLQNKRMVRSMPEALKETPGVMLQKTSQGQSSPFIRGFTGFRTLLLIDGVRLNNSVFRDGPNQYWSTVDFFSIQMLEIVKGPGSTLYGSDAVGGVVNAITRENIGPGEGYSINPRLFYRYASGERSHVGRAEAYGHYENVGFLGGFYYKNFGDIRAGNDFGILDKTAYHEYGGDIKFNIGLTDNAELVLAHYMVDQNNVERTHKTIFSKSFKGTTVGNELRRRLDQDRYLTYAQLRLFDLDHFFQNASFTASWHYQKEEQDRFRGNLRRDIQGFTVNTAGLQMKFESKTPIGTLTYGVDYYRDDVQSFRDDFNADGSLRAIRIQGPIADNSNYDLLGVYIQDEISLLDKSLIITPAVRYNHAWVDVDQFDNGGVEDSFNDDWGSVSGGINFIWAFHKNWALFGGVNNSFRTPNLSDLTRFNSARSNEIETPVRDLDPEYFLTYEIGFKTNYKDKLYFQASYFYTRIFNSIIRFPTGNVIDGENEVTKGNDGDGYVHGVELEGTFYITPEISLFAGFAWLDGRVSTFPDPNAGLKDEVLDRLPPVQGFVGLNWTHPSKRYWLEGLITVARDQTRLSTRDSLDTDRIPPGGTPGYVIGTIRGGAKITDWAILTVSIENVGDVNYRIHGSGQQAPGFNAIVAIDMGYPKAGPNENETEIETED